MEMQFLDNLALGFSVAFDLNTLRTA